MFMGVLLNFLSLRGVFGSYDDAVFGLILIVIMLFAPDGILSLLAGRKKKAATVQPVQQDGEA
jgi:ABC-type branched-subunit amino acid transport system permease subunit